MSNIIFPENYIIDLPHLNIEMMQHYSKMWNLEHKKMEKGHFEGSIFATHTPRIQFASACYSQGFMSKGDFPDGCVVLIYSHTNATYNFQNTSIEANEIIVLRKGDEIDILTFGEIDMRTIVIEEELFYKTFYEFFGDITHNSFENKRLVIQPQMLSIFHHTIDTWTNYLRNELPTLNSKPTYEEIESNILRQLFSCIMFNSLKKDRKQFQVKAVRDLLHESLEHNIDISMLTKEFNISESQLHHVFKSSYGITPKKYFQMLRFNAVNKELKLADSSEYTVSEIAIKYNFWHMNHFSAEYKKIFEETPSNTLSK